MNFNLSSVLILFSLITFVSPAFAGDTPSQPAGQLLYAQQITQEGAKSFPYSEFADMLWGKPACVGSAAPNPALTKAHNVEENKLPSSANVKVPTAFDLCFVPVREASGLRLSGVIITYDYDGKFLSRNIFTEVLPSGKPFSKRVFAAGRYYEVNLKFVYK